MFFVTSAVKEFVVAPVSVVLTFFAEAVPDMINMKNKTMKANKILFFMLCALLQI